MDCFDSGEHLGAEADFSLCGQDWLGSTCEVNDDLDGPLHNDPFLDSSEIEGHIFAMLESPEEDSTPPPAPTSQPKQPPREPDSGSSSEKRPPRMKNSNAIKKIGRMILSRLGDYELPSGGNAGVARMLLRLAGEGEGEGGKGSDSFNTSHLQALYEAGSRTVSGFNLRTTRRIFSRELRREVLTSKQLKGESRLVYLNTFKCSSLRCMNSRLASRLQASESPH